MSDSLGRKPRRLGANLKLQPAPTVSVTSTRAVEPGAAEPTSAAPVVLDDLARRSAEQPNLELPVLPVIQETPQTQESAVANEHVAERGGHRADGVAPRDAGLSEGVRSETSGVSGEPVIRETQQSLETPETPEMLDSSAMARPAASDVSAGKPAGSRQIKETVYLDASSLERVKNAAWWLRTTKQKIYEEAIAARLAEIEREHGGPFPQREGDLQRGPRPR